ncbi:hypothetical protein DNTS_027780, partial [Danionella cerebrum]
LFLFYRYSIDWKSDLDSFFDIDPVRGTISTNEPLDRESIAQHNITVLATKVNNPMLTSRVAVTVHVLDINEFPPELAMPYETFVCESAKAGQVMYDRLHTLTLSLNPFLLSVTVERCEWAGMAAQVIHVISAVDQDLPQAGHRFSFRSPQEGVKSKNFTIRDYGNNTAGVVALRSGFKRRSLELYHLPIVIEDGGLQMLSSTSTLTIRVCGCDREGSLLTCSAEAIFLPVGLSTGALIAILVCIVILLVIVVLYVGVRRQKKKETLMTSKEDIRDNVIHYDDEGGGEEDTHAFDMGTLRNPKVVKENLFRRDVKPDQGLCPRKPNGSQNSNDISNFIRQRLQEHDGDTSAPPYDSLATYAYEGEGSVAESLSSIESVKAETEEDYNYLNEWGPRFKTLAGIFGERSESQSDVTSSTPTESKN